MATWWASGLHGFSEPYDEACEAEEELVDEEQACPECGERRAGWLLWWGRRLAQCYNCGTEHVEFGSSSRGRALDEAELEVLATRPGVKGSEVRRLLREWAHWSGGYQSRLERLPGYFTRLDAATIQAILDGVTVMHDLEEV